jgi:hypothetical protein
MAESQAIDYPNRFPASGLTNVMFALGFVAGQGRPSQARSSMEKLKTILYSSTVMSKSNTVGLVWTILILARDGISCFGWRIE